ncbi:MAG TPA: DUF2232 domain-containing protein [Symbiobacteriaceae bacterium]|jgi:uncharacterized protein YybS (DUF2232 family)|nr:DUF2232 domain-containing protein [Symbiobacteriaceae bacterium]
MHQRSVGVRGLVFGGIMAGLVVLFALVPLLSIFIPIPLVLTYVRFSGKTAVLTSIVAALLTATFVGPIQAFLITVPFGVLPGLIFGYGLSRKLKPLTVFLLAVAVFFVGFAVDYGVTRIAVVGGRDPMEVALENPQVREQLDKSFAGADQFFQQLEQASKTDQQRESWAKQRIALQDMKKDPLRSAWIVMPLAVFASGAFNSWLNYRLCRWILPRFGHEVPRFTPFSEFRLPTWSVWLFFLANLGANYLNQPLLEAPWWVKVLANVVPPMLYIFLAYGLAVAYGWLRRKQNMTKGMAIAFSLGLAFLPNGLGMQLYVMLAMWDSVFDFRGLGHGMWKRPEPNP